MGARPVGVAASRDRPSDIERIIDGKGQVAEPPGAEWGKPGRRAGHEHIKIGVIG
jgi:hypothetical protein